MSVYTTFWPKISKKSKKVRIRPFGTTHAISKRLSQLFLKNGIMSGQQNQAVTELKSIKFHYDWLFKMSTYNHHHTSCPFTIQDYGNEEWSMSLCVGPHQRGSLYLCLNDKPREFSIDLTLKVIIPSSPTHGFTKKYSGPLKQQNGSPSFITLHTLTRATNPIDNMVQIICKVELKPLKPPPPVNIEPQFHIPEYGLSHDFGSLYNDEITADVTLTVASKKFHAHRVILTARSSVFAAMFRNNMKETITKNVDITDLDADILEQILRFIYTDQIPDLKDNAIDLLDAADKYDLRKLKAVCEQTLYKNVNVEEAAEILVMADRHRAPQLKTQVFRFIKSHMKEAIETEGYKNLKEHHPGLIIELFEALATSSN